MRTVVAGAVACLSLGCASDIPPIGPGAAVDIAVLSGDEQEGFPRRVLPDSLRVAVTDRNGDPVRGVTVLWEVEATEGNVDPVASTTNVNGVASTSFTLGDAPLSTVTARAEGRNAATTLTARANGFIFDCAPPEVTNDNGDIRALGCAASAVGDFAGEVALAVERAPAGITVHYATAMLDLTEVDGPLSTSALLTIGFAVPSGVHVVVLGAESGAEIVADSVLVTVR